MMSIADDRFADEIQNMVEEARADHVAQVEQDEWARLERERRARDLVEHVTRRFSAVSSRDSKPGIEYVQLEAPEGEDLPMLHVLNWRASQPHRTLEIRLSERTGRYWFHLLVMDELSGSGRIVEDGHGDVSRLTVDDIDQLIRRVADKRAWQRCERGSSRT